MKDFEYYKSIIQSAEEPYDREKSGRTGCEAAGKLRTAVIKKYFAKNAGLDLDAIRLSTKSTWEKAVELAVFVARNIPHDNQKVGLGKETPLRCGNTQKRCRRVSTADGMRFCSVSCCWQPASKTVL